MRRILPNPTMSLVVAVVWLVLNQSLAPAHVLLAVVLGVLMGLGYQRLRPPPLRIRNRMKLLTLFLTVTHDVVRSNLALLRIIVGGRTRDLNSGFVRIPLELQSPYSLAILACIITATPGTIWMSYESHRGVLLIHVFDLVDDAEWVETITRRYAQPLQEIFE